MIFCLTNVRNVTKLLKYIRISKFTTKYQLLLFSLEVLRLLLVNVIRRHHISYTSTSGAYIITHPDIYARAKSTYTLSRLRR